MLRKRIKQFNEKASWLKKGVIYHRGKHGSGVMENTIEAFNLACEEGLGIELDIRLTSDNKIIVFHDDNLKRLYNIDKKVANCTYRELCEYSEGTIPLFTDVLNLINDRVGLMVEIKSVKFSKLEIICNVLKNYRGRYVIVSFNPGILRYFKKNDPSIIRGQLSCSFKNSNYNLVSKFVLSRMLFNFVSKPHFISYGIESCDCELLAKYKKKGYFIIGWTYNNEKNKLKLKRVYDNMIIEDLNIREF